MTTLHPSILHINGNLSEQTVKMINQMADKVNEMEKYSYYKNHEQDLQYTIVRNVGGVETFIASTDTTGNAHFISEACSKLTTLTAENQRLRKGIKLCLAAINGGLDGLELDNTCDVTENSFIVQQLKDQAEILNQALSGDSKEVQGE